MSLFGFRLHTLYYILFRKGSDAGEHRYTRFVCMCIHPETTYIKRRKFQFYISLLRVGISRCVIPLLQVSYFREKEHNSLSGYLSI